MLIQQTWIIRYLGVWKINYTLGLDYKNEKKNDLDQINNYFELKLATVFRDKEEKFIPNKSTIHKKNSNLFGSID